MNDAVGMIEREAGPSWARPNWPVEELDELNLGLDPTQATIEKFKAAVSEKAAAAGASPVGIRRAAEDSIRALMLILTYLVRGHLAANLDVPVVSLELSEVMDFPHIPELREPGRQAQCLRMIGAAMSDEA